MNVLMGDRIILRNWEKKDCQDLFEYASLSNIGPTVGWQPHKNVDESKKIIEKFINDDDVYALELKSEKKVIGSVGFHNRNFDSKYDNISKREITIVINPMYWNNGYAHEASNLLIDYAFNVLGLDMVWMCCNVNNKKSQKICNKQHYIYVCTKDVILQRLDNKKVRMKYYVLFKNTYNKKDNMGK